MCLVRAGFCSVKKSSCRCAGFTMVELLVVISIIAMLLAILLPSLGKARLAAKILKVNAELRQVSLALELYYRDTGEYPPTMADCSGGKLCDHIGQLPELLTKGNYLPAAERHNPMDTVMADVFNPDSSYKYSAPGEIILDRDIIEKRIKARLWVPDGFPEKSSTDENKGRYYYNTKDSPVKWVIYSLGPNFNEDEFIQSCNRLYPVPKETWYDSKTGKGLIVRMRLANEKEIGTFEVRR